MVKVNVDLLAVVNDPGWYARRSGLLESFVRDVATHARDAVVAFLSAPLRCHGCDYATLGAPWSGDLEAVVVLVKSTGESVRALYCGACREAVGHGGNGCNEDLVVVG